MVDSSGALVVKLGARRDCFLSHAFTTGFGKRSWHDEKSIRRLTAEKALVKERGLPSVEESIR